MNIYYNSEYVLFKKQYNVQRDLNNKETLNGFDILTFNYLNNNYLLDLCKVLVRLHFINYSCI